MYAKLSGALGGGRSSIRQALESRRVDGAESQPRGDRYRSTSPRASVPNQSLDIDIRA
jgi:hypothetical protein